MTRRTRTLAALAGLGLAACTFNAAHAQAALVTGKKITVPALGTQQNVGSLPMNMILTPNGRYAISSDMGFRQSLYCIDTRTGQAVSHLDFNQAKAGSASNGNGLYYGLAIAPNGTGSTLYAGQGSTGKVAVVNVASDGTLSLQGTIGQTNGDFTAGVALDGRGYLYAAVNQNFLLTAPFDPRAFILPSALVVYNIATGQEVGRYRFTNTLVPSAPVGQAAAFGPVTPPNFALAVAAVTVGAKTKVYVSSQRDGSITVLDTTVPTMPTLSSTITLPQTNPSGAPTATGFTDPTQKYLPQGAHPIGLLLSPDGGKLYTANAQTDTVSVISTTTDAVTGTADLRPTGAKDLAGATPTGLALSTDPFNPGLFVSLGDMNAVAVVDPASLAVRGYIPTGWYPTSVAVAPGKKLLVANAKGVKTRNPNKFAQGPGGAFGTYDLNIIEGTVATLPVPTPTVLRAQTRLVLANNGITPTTSAPANPFANIGLGAGKITHVIYIVKENRTYDQVLGDLPQGNGDPSLTLFGQNVTPNFHALASRFVLLDNFYDNAEASGDGWPWSTQGMANEYVIKNLPYNYSGRGRNYDFEGSNNLYPTGGFPATDPYGVPFSGLFTKGAPAIPDVAEAPGGHIWDNVEQAGLSYRNYGFYYALTFKGNGLVPDNFPASTGIQPAGFIPTSLPGTAPDFSKMGRSDYNFREFDLNYADSDAPALDGAPYKTARYTNDPNPVSVASAPSSRFMEFKREFAEMLKADPTGASVPSFLTVRFMSDHTEGATPGSPSARAHVADNDYGVAQFVDLISHSPVWQHTAIFVIEDDAQDGQDHVDAHRSTCYVISPYIKQNSVDHTFYNTDSVLKTMEQLMGLAPMSQYDAIANPILDFDTMPSNGSPYIAVLPDPRIITEKNPVITSLKPGTMAYHLARLSQKMDFTHADAAPSALLNQMIWKSVKGMNSPVPAPRHSPLVARLWGIGPSANAHKRAAQGSDD